MSLIHVTLDDLVIEDEASFRHVAIYDDLKRIVRASDRRFLVPSAGTTLSWDRALFLNLGYWDASTSDVLVSKDIPADVVAHVAWHHLADEHVAASPEAHLLAECIASAFDVYLIGRLIGHSPDSTFLASQVPRMAEVAADAGMSAAAFEELLEDVSREPERAFEDLRALLFDAATALVPEMSPAQASAVLEELDGHRFGPLLHHYEIATWVLRARIERRATSVAPSENGASLPPSHELASLARTNERLSATSAAVETSSRPRTSLPSAAEVDKALRDSDPLTWLCRAWVEPRLDMR